MPRVNGQLAVARAFGDQSLKAHLSSEPDTRHVPIDETIEFVILASDGLWKVSCYSSLLMSVFPFLFVFDLFCFFIGKNNFNNNNNNNNNKELSPAIQKIENLYAWVYPLRTTLWILHYVVWTKTW